MESKKLKNDDKYSQVNTEKNLSEEIKIENNYYLEQLDKIFKARAKNLFSYTATEVAYVITKINDLSIKIIAMDDTTEKEKNMAKNFIDPDAYPISSFDIFEIRPELLSMANKKEPTEPTLSEIRMEYLLTTRSKNLLLMQIERDVSIEYNEKILEQHNKHLLELEEEYPEYCI